MIIGTIYYLRLTLYAHVLFNPPVLQNMPSIRERNTSKLNLDVSKLKAIKNTGFLFSVFRSFVPQTFKALAPSSSLLANEGETQGS